MKASEALRRMEVDQAWQGVNLRRLTRRQHEEFQKAIRRQLDDLRKEEEE